MKETRSRLPEQQPVLRIPRAWRIGQISTSITRAMPHMHLAISSLRWAPRLAPACPTTTHFRSSSRNGLVTGLMFQASYTWSHSIDDTSGYEGSGAAPGLGRAPNPFNFGSYRGDSNFDARHRFVINYDYEVPTSRCWNKRVREIRVERLACRRHHHAADRVPYYRWGFWIPLPHV